MITLSIVSHGQKDLVKELLDDISRLIPRTVSQIILTHNLTDDRAEFPASIGHISIAQIYRAKQLGFGANHNAAFKTVSNDFFCVLNPDIRINENPFDKLLQQFDTPKLGLVAPQILNPDGSVADSARGPYTIWSSLAGFSKKSRLEPINPTWLAGMFMLFRQKAFADVNGFDERYFMYVEDVDICDRVAKAGWQLKYDHQTSVIHNAQRANRRSLRHLAWHVRSAVRWWTS